MENLKLRLDEGELIEFTNSLHIVELENFRGKYIIKLNGKIIKSSKSFKTISKHIEMTLKLKGLTIVEKPEA